MNLQRFCAVEDVRSYLLKPWRDAGWLYATNGHVLVRIPDDGRPDIPDKSPRAPNCGALFAKHFQAGTERSGGSGT